MTQSTIDIWLISQQIETLNRSMLPSNKEVLPSFMNKRMLKNETINKDLNSTVNEVLDIWLIASISTTQKCNVIKKLRKLHDDWQMLKKNKCKKYKFFR